MFVLFYCDWHLLDFFELKMVPAIIYNSIIYNFFIFLFKAESDFNGTWCSL